MPCRGRLTGIHPVHSPPARTPSENRGSRRPALNRTSETHGMDAAMISLSPKPCRNAENRSLFDSPAFPAKKGLNLASGVLRRFRGACAPETWGCEDHPPLFPDVWGDENESVYAICGTAGRSSGSTGCSGTELGKRRLAGEPSPGFAYCNPRKLGRNVESCGNRMMTTRARSEAKISGSADLLISSIVRPLMFAPT